MSSNLNEDVNMDIDLDGDLVDLAAIIKAKLTKLTVWGDLEFLQAKLIDPTLRMKRTPKCICHPWQEGMMLTLKLTSTKEKTRKIGRAHV